MPFSRANAEMEMTRERGFTLIELLVVIVIISVLAGLSFPVYQSIQNSAKKTQAKNDITQIVTAVNAFYTEYGKYPIDSTVTTDTAATYGGTPDSKNLFDTLRGKTTTLNTRQIVFISPAEDTNQVSPKGKVGSDGQFHDPWSSPYVIRMDADYDNQITPNPYGANNGAGPEPIRQGVIAWSLGKDTKPGKDGDSKYTGSDDVISWQ
jgi:prepilin-type N-terminal cleavage/methylation domain-containing protein